jgi:hypothetical protein
MKKHWECSSFALQCIMVIGTVAFFLVTLAINEWVFTQSEFVRGINWVFLPAGARLLCILLFGGAGALGVLIASWIASFYYFFPHDFIRAFAGGVIGTAAPFAVYLIARQVFGLRGSLVNLTTRRLLICIVSYAAASASLHHVWFALQGNMNGFLEGLAVMFIGDLIGTLIVIYALKAILGWVMPRRR